LSPSRLDRRRANDWFRANQATIAPAWAAGRYEAAAAIFLDIVNNDTCVDFLAFPAYERID